MPAAQPRRWRIELPGHVRFLTFSCHRRLPLLNHDAIRQLLVDRLAVVCQQQQVRLLAWVIMPEHVHLLVFPEAQVNMTRFTHALKRPVAEQVLRRWRTLNASILQKIGNTRGYHFWQRGGGDDRNITCDDELREKIAYIHENPVRRKLVPVAIDYAWSSARGYAGLPDAKLRCRGLRD